MNQSDKLLYVIVPYRDRVKHLNVFLDKIPKYLEKQNINFKILVIEQFNNKLFNRGKMLNIGVKEALLNHFDKNIEPYFVLHDVDIIPIQKINYSYNDKITHLYGHTHTFGGMLLIDKDNYIKANGFSNNYNGWGREDGDFKFRVKYNKLPIDNSRFHKRPSRFVKELPHKQSSRNNFENNMKYYKSVEKKPDIIQKDGFNSTKYKIVNKIEYDNYTLYQVDDDISQ